jgi:hypothetical protein
MLVGLPRERAFPHTDAITLQTIARMSDFEAELVGLSIKRIADSRKLIAQADFLLHRR